MLPPFEHVYSPCSVFVVAFALHYICMGAVYCEECAMIALKLQYGLKCAIMSLSYLFIYLIFIPPFSARPILGN